MTVNVLRCEKGFVIMWKNNLIPRSFMANLFRGEVFDACNLLSHYLVETEVGERACKYAGC